MIYPEFYQLLHMKVLHEGLLLDQLLGGFRLGGNPADDAIILGTDRPVEPAARRYDMVNQDPRQVSRSFNHELKPELKWLSGNFW